MLEVFANDQVKAKLATGSVASSGCISDNILFALVTFSLYQPTALLFSINAKFASSITDCTKYFSVSIEPSLTSIPASFAACFTLSCNSILNCLLVGNGLLLAKSKLFSNLLT